MASGPASRSRRLAGLSLALGAAPILLGACGYRAAPRGLLPGGARRVLLAPPNPHRTDEPELASLLVLGLERELARAGASVSTARRGFDSVLVPRILDLDPVGILVGGRGILAGRMVRLRAEFLLEDPSGRTLWRSGLVEAEAVVPLSASRPRESEQARRLGLAELASRVARQVVELMTSGL
jgi:hypothetical protein